ncbi:hypothetical protein ACFQL9_13175 [Halobaculum lipolyticum]|uniref:Uncharacterized protein n=1 Tax=Halobaculum lipolyticum TaxID=3032001 RepID=A0ABD5WIJ5_9EURY
MVDPSQITSAEDVAEATGQSIETVARGWHEMAKEQPGETDTESESESSDRRRMFSDD